MKILITGFESFGGAEFNPSQAAVEALRNSAECRDWRFAVLPVSFARAGAQITELIGEFAPDIVLMLGLAGRATSYRLESQALNLTDARIPDNDGKQPVNAPIVIGGAEWLKSRWPVTDLVNSLNKLGYETVVSTDAGKYVCNATYYAALETTLSTRQQPGSANPIVGFIHIPPDRSTAETAELVKLIVKLLRDIREKC